MNPRYRPILSCIGRLKNSCITESLYPYEQFELRANEPTSSRDNLAHECVLLPLGKRRPERLLQVIVGRWESERS